MLESPAQQRMPPIHLGQIHSLPVRRRLENPHHNLQDVQPLAAAALVHPVLVQVDEAGLYPQLIAQDVQPLFAGGRTGPPPRCGGVRRRPAP